MELGNFFSFFLSPNSAGKRTACLQESIPPLSLSTLDQAFTSPPPAPAHPSSPMLLPFETLAAESKGHHRSSRLGAGRVVALWLREQPGSLGLWGTGWGWDSRFWVARLVGKQTIGCPRNDAFRKSQPRDLRWPTTVCFYSRIYDGFKSIDMLTACKGNGSMHRAGFTSAEITVHTLRGLPEHRPCAVPDLGAGDAGRAQRQALSWRCSWLVADKAVVCSG